MRTQPKTCPKITPVVTTKRLAFWRLIKRVAPEFCIVNNTLAFGREARPLGIGLGNLKIVELTRFEARERGDGGESGVIVVGSRELRAGLEGRVGHDDEAKNWRDMGGDGIGG